MYFDFCQKVQTIFEAYKLLGSLTVRHKALLRYLNFLAPLFFELLNFLVLLSAALRVHHNVIQLGLHQSLQHQLRTDAMLDRPRPEGLL